jgi:hypothetical protein
LSETTWPESPARSLGPEGLEGDVYEAIKEICANFTDLEVVAWADGEGGAFVVIDGVDIGSTWSPFTTWVGCRILNAYPEADVYPIFVRGDLQRADGVALVAPINPGQQFAERSAVMVSRTTPRRTAATASAATRLINTVTFLRGHA